MSKAKVFFTADISPEGLLRAYEALGVKLPGKVAVKLSTGEPGGHNFLQPKLIAPLVAQVRGTIVECNTAYEGRRNTSAEHWKAMEEHGFPAIAPCDLLDEEGEMRHYGRAGGAVHPCYKRQTFDRKFCRRTSDQL